MYDLQIRNTGTRVQRDTRIHECMAAGNATRCCSRCVYAAKRERERERERGWREIDLMDQWLSRPEETDNGRAAACDRGTCHFSRPAAHLISGLLASGLTLLTP